MSLRKTKRNNKKMKLAIKPRGIMPPPTTIEKNKRNESRKKLSRQTKIQ
jgi:hypothetical protein